MQEGTVGRRYARALIATLESEGQEKLQKVEEELSAIAGLLDKRTGNVEFRQAMLNPSFNAEQRKAVLKDIAESHKLEDTTSKFVRLLVEKDRLRDLPVIARAFRDEVDARVGRVRATILSAKPLSPSALADIVRGLEKQTGKKVVPDVAVDAASSPVCKRASAASCSMRPCAPNSSGFAADLNLN